MSTVFETLIIPSMYNEMAVSLSNNTKTVIAFLAEFNYRIHH